MKNINKLFNGRNYTIQFVDDCSSMILEAKRKAAGEEQEATEQEVTKPTKAIEATEPTKTKTKPDTFLNKIKIKEKIKMNK